MARCLVRVYAYRRSHCRKESRVVRNKRKRYIEEVEGKWKKSITVENRGVAFAARNPLFALHQRHGRRKASSRKWENVAIGTVATPSLPRTVSKQKELLLSRFSTYELLDIDSGVTSNDSDLRPYWKEQVAEWSQKLWLPWSDGFDYCGEMEQRCCGVLKQKFIMENKWLKRMKFQQKRLLFDDVLAICGERQFCKGVVRLGILVWGCLSSAPTNITDKNFDHVLTSREKLYTATTCVSIHLSIQLHKSVHSFFHFKTIYSQQIKEMQKKSPRNAPSMQSLLILAFVHLSLDIPPSKSGIIGSADVGRIIRLCKYMDELISKKVKLIFSTSKRKKPKFQRLDKTFSRIKRRIMGLQSEIYRKVIVFFTHNLIQSSSRCLRGHKS
ncbi:hypothetical protein G9A89_020119 [Geosiphon pyriformis]|nr:hypothetical protein G9A89_020119 [Geosiphon pyriformis]